MSDHATAESVMLEWKQLGEHRTGAPVHRRVSAASLLLYFSSDESGSPGLMAIGCATASTELLKLDAIRISTGRRSDGQNVLTVSLIDLRLLDVFAELCVFVVSSALACPRNTDAIGFLSEAILEWRQLLRLGSRSRLSAIEQRGLFAELLLFESQLRLGSEEVVASAWCGPRGAPQDFRFDHTWIECKSVTAQDHCLHISSLEQLESDGVALFLVVLPLTEDTTGTSLDGLVLRVRNKLLQSPRALIRFNLALASVGYCGTADYSIPSYQASRTRWYQVQDGFPRLYRANVNVGIANARYQISMAALAPFAVEEPILES